MVRARAVAPLLLPILGVAVAYFAAAEAAQHWLRASGNAPVVWIASETGMRAAISHGFMIGSHMTSAQPVATSR